MERFKRNFAQFFKFGLVGLSNTVISYGLYALFVYLGLHYIAASVISFIVSVFNSFCWNYKFVFKYKSTGKRDFTGALLRTYAAYSVSGFIIGPVLLYIFIDIFGVSEYIAPFYGLPISIPLNYLMNKLWAFKSNGGKHTKPCLDRETM